MFPHLIIKIFIAVHRKGSYPHMHVPLKAPRSMKRRTTSPLITPIGTPQGTPADISESSTATAASHTPTSVRSPIFKITDSETGGLSSLTLQEEDDTGCISSESECIVSDPTGFRSPELSPDKKVQFVIGSNIEDIPEDDSESNDQKPPQPPKEKKHKRG